jgi:hypothetical protein
MHFTACHSPKGAGPAQRNKKGEIKRVPRPQTLTALILRNLAFSSVVSAILLSLGLVYRRKDLGMGILT